MGISDTFAVLAQRPPALRREFCLAALASQHEKLQCAAVQMLLDADGLDSPDLVIDRFASLLPGAVDVAREWKTELIGIARAHIATDGAPNRQAAFAVISAFGGGDCIAALERAVGDQDAEVGALGVKALEAQLQELVAAARQADDGQLPPRPEQELWQAAETALQAYSRHGSSGIITLIGEFGRKAVPLVSRAVRTPKGAELAAAMKAAFENTGALAAADLTMGLIAHKSESVRDVGNHLLAARRDPGFGAAIADQLVADAALRLELSEDLWVPLVVTSVRHLAEPTALELLRLLFEGVQDPVKAQRRVEPGLEHPAARVQIEVLGMLRQLRCVAGFAAVGELLRNGDDAARRVAAEVVLELGPPERAALLTPLLGSRDDELRQLANREVVEVSFRRFLSSFDDMDAETRAAAARVLTRIDSCFASRLAEEFHAMDPARRMKALRVVDLVDAGEDMREPLLELLSDPDLHVRATAIRIVEVAGSIEATKTLIDALSHRDRRIRANAIEAFEDLGDVGNIELVRPFLRDRDNRVRANAAKAMWNLGSHEGRDTLAAMLTHSEPMMRISAIWAIGELRFVGARAMLEQREMVEAKPEVLAKLREVLATYGAAEEQKR